MYGVQGGNYKPVGSDRSFKIQKPERKTGRKGNMYRFICAGMLLALLLAGCGKDKDSFKTLMDFTGKRIASQEGTTFPKFIDLVIPDVEHNTSLTSVPEMASGVEKA